MAASDVGSIPAVAQHFVQAIIDANPPESSETHWVILGCLVVTTFCAALAENGLPVTSHELARLIETQGKGLELLPLSEKVKEDLHQIQAYHPHFYQSTLGCTLATIANMKG